VDFTSEAVKLSGSAVFFVEKNLNYGFNFRLFLLKNELW
jgi:hypothetical protein